MYVPVENIENIKTIYVVVHFPSCISIIHIELQHRQSALQRTKKKENNNNRR